MVISASVTISKVQVIISIKKWPDKTPSEFIKKDFLAPRGD